MSARITEVADMGRYWRVVSVSHGRVSGQVVALLPVGKSGEVHVTPMDITLWHDDDRRSGRILHSDGFTAFIKDGTVRLPEHMIRSDARDDVADVQTDLEHAIVLAVETALTTVHEQYGGGL